MPAQSIVASHPTEFFRDLVKTAMETRKVSSPEEVEYYLVNLLAAHLRTPPEMLSRPLALTYLEAETGAPGSRFERFRRVGDTALFLAGMFSECLERSLVQPSYYVNLGSLAYSRTADTCVRHLRDMFAALAAPLAAQAQQFFRIGTGGTAGTYYPVGGMIANAVSQPGKIVVTNRSEPRLNEMKAVHQKIGMQIPVEYHLAPTPDKNDAVTKTLPPASMVVNATGLGKDAPGSPLTDAVEFPENGVAWEFNYRGDLVFLDQANAQRASKNLKIEDGWVYFIHGWTRVIAEVFHIDIPKSGPGFERLSELAIDATRR